MRARACGKLGAMNTNRLSHIAALIGEPARTAMLMALMDGRALTAHELAGVGRIAAATASRHLGLLVEAGLLQVERQGRHRYHRLASGEVAQVLEGLVCLAGAQPAGRVITGPRDGELRRARTCYDHLAGRLGVAIADHLRAENAITWEGEAGAQLTPTADAVLQRLGVAPSGLLAGRSGRVVCRPCMDWSERRSHLAGRLGAMICAHCLDQGWLARTERSRALRITPPGALALRDWLGVARWLDVVGD